MTTGTQFRDAAVAKRGYAYGTASPWRWTGERGFFDCSGLTYYAARRCGLIIPATSYLIARYCAVHHLDRQSLDVALHTPGMVLNRGPNHGYDPPPRGSTDHVAITIGDGRNIIEAKGHAWGVLIDGALGREWDNASYLPGLTYGVVQPAPPPIPLPPPVTTDLGDAMRITDIPMRLGADGNGHIPVPGIKASQVLAVTGIATPSPEKTGRYTTIPIVNLTIGADGWAEVVVEKGGPGLACTVRVAHA